ncbi:MAG: class I SAM-dependent methyltransferase [Betaproteobacteria bacterium]|nr:class I SAM-dependent methyltransferase [Betaproteobacteria bacterium]
MNQADMPSSAYFTGSRIDLLGVLPSACNRVLDVGCGFGGFGRSLREAGVNEVYGVEINPDAAPYLKNDYTQFWIGDVETVEIPSDTTLFDCIVFADLLEHLRDPWGTLLKYKKWLRPGGYVVASIPNVRNIALVYNLVLRGRWKYEDSGLLDRTHLRFFTRKEIVDMFEASGLKIDKMMYNRENLSLFRRIATAPLIAFIPDLSICQFLIRARLT